MKARAIGMAIAAVIGFAVIVQGDDSGGMGLVYLWRDGSGRVVGIGQWGCGYNQLNVDGVQTPNMEVHGRFCQPVWQGGMTPDESCAFAGGYMAVFLTNVGCGGAQWCWKQQCFAY